jgi:hypothetical protein
MLSRQRSSVSSRADPPHVYLPNIMTQKGKEVANGCKCNYRIAAAGIGRDVKVGREHGDGADWSCSGAACEGEGGVVKPCLQ